MPVRKLKSAVRKIAKKAKAAVSGKKGARKTAKQSAAKNSARRKRVGDVLGVSNARVPKGTPRATVDRGGNPRGIELPKLRKGPRLLPPSRVRG